MHGYWLDQAGVSGYYVPLEIHPDNFEAALKNMPKLGFRGANVTIPHKERALEIADFVSERAQRIGAANTLYFDVDGKIHADNTDGYGFITNLKKGARVECKGRSCTCFGRWGCGSGNFRCLDY